MYHGENLYHLKDFHGLENLGHHTQLLQVPMQACLQKCSKHHSDSTISQSGERPIETCSISLSQKGHYTCKFICDYSRAVSIFFSYKTYNLKEQMNYTSTKNWVEMAMLIYKYVLSYRHTERI